MKQLRGLGIFLIVIGVGSFILPRVGLQFRLIDIFGPGSAPIVGIAAAVIGIVIVGASMMGGKSTSTPATPNMKQSTSDKQKTQ